MRKIIEAFKNMPGILDRVFELRSNPLLLEAYDGKSPIDLSRYYESPKREKFRYRGIESDIENWRKDRENFARDFNKAFQAAKQRLGA